MNQNKERNLNLIAKHAGFGIIGRLFFILIRLGITLLLTRTLGPKDYGLYVLTISILGVAISISLLGLEPGMVKFVSQHIAQNNTVKLVRTITLGFISVSLSSVLILIFLLLFSEHLSQHVFKDFMIADVLEIAAFSIPFLVITNLSLSVLQGAKLVHIGILIQQIFIPFLRFGLIAIFILFGQQIIGVAKAWVITSIISCLASISMVLTKITSRLKYPQKSDAKEIFIFSLPLLLSQLFYRNINIIGILVIGIFLPSDQTGVYGVANRIIPLLVIPLLSFNTIFSPIISNLFVSQKIEELSSIFKTQNYWVVLISLPIISLTLYFSEDIVSIFGSGFKDSQYLLCIFIVGQIFNVCSGSTNVILSMTGRSDFNLLNSFLLCFFNAVLAVILIRPWGVLGVAYAYSLSIIIIQTLQLIEVYFLYRIHPFRFNLLKPFIGCGIGILIVHVVNKEFSVEHRLIDIILQVGIFMMIYFTVAYFTWVNKDDRLLIQVLKNRLFETNQSQTQRFSS